jgi:phage anti-repressor protein
MDGNLSGFLKQHSAIPAPFIDRFLSMYNPDTVQTDFVVDLDRVAEWLQVPKFKLMQTLRASYRVDIDYVSSKGIFKTGKYGGNNYKAVMLTPDCFKRLCMRSRSSRAEEVRTYFIELESLLVRYRSTLLKGMDHEIAEMQRSLKPKVASDSAGYVYVIKAHAHKDSVYKIGRTRDSTSG